MTGTHPSKARLEVAWNASANGLGRGAGYSSAALCFDAAWPHGAGTVPARCSATVDRAGDVRDVVLGDRLEAQVSRRGRWTHVRIAAEDGDEVLVATFDGGRLAHCRSRVPEAAGLPGGSYDAPTAILELYAQG